MTEDMQSLLLVSQAVGNSSRAERHILSRIVIPVEVASRYDELPKGHIWWVEKTVRSFYLRAKLYVNEATVERELKSGLRRAVWHLDTIRSERITWPGTQRREGNVTKSLAGVVLDTLGGLAFTPVTAELDMQLEEGRLSISDQSFRFEHATRMLRQLFAKTKSYLPLATVPPLSWCQAIHYARAYFAREELISVSGRDPYEVAAAVLAGYAEMPEKTTGVEHMDDLPAAEIVEFTELDEEHLGYIERRWKRDSEPSSKFDKLEIKTKRHQQILQLLARHVRAEGLRPTYNRHVDLRIEGKYADVLFEVKTADTLNFQDQVRRAVGQLLEYRYRYKRYNVGRDIKLATVIEAGASVEQYEFARSFLSDLGIAMVLWKPDTALFDGLVEVLS
jgi:hypothetical protein